MLCQTKNKKQSYSILFLKKLLNESRDFSVLQPDIKLYKRKEVL